MSDAATAPRVGEFDKFPTIFRFCLCYILCIQPKKEIYNSSRHQESLLLVTFAWITRHRSHTHLNQLKSWPKGVLVDGKTQN
jgi:hypothetical protein